MNVKKMRDFFKPHYRIVAKNNIVWFQTNPYRGYIVEVWCWYWPFWVDADPYRSFKTLEDAERFAVGFVSVVVKNLGTMRGTTDE